MANKQSSIREVIGSHISLSRFARCLDISRPTLYKYMDAYDCGSIELIPYNVLKIFDTATSPVSRKNLRNYFDEIYENYERTEERRMRDNPVPPDIAEIVDSEDLTVKDIDLMIEKAVKHKARLLKRNPVDEDEIERVSKDIRDLGYTREMVEKRQSENRFVLIMCDYWIVCTGPEESDTIDFDEEAELDVPDIESKFRFYMARARSGFTLFFCNQAEGDNVEVQVLTGPREDYTKDIMGTFRPEPGMNFIRIPDLFDEDMEEFFRFRVIRSNNGVVLNKAIGKFAK